MDDKILDLHIKNGYFIKFVQFNNTNGCYVEFPQSIIYPNLRFESEIFCYFIEDCKIKITKQGKNIKDEVVKTVKVPNYARRIVILNDILIESLKRNINHSLIVCYDKNGIKQEKNNAFLLLENNVDIDKEKLLLNVLPKNILGVDCNQYAKENDIVDGYNLMKKAFESGGLLYV